MSQREKAGLSWPGFAVSAGEPLDGVPRRRCTVALFNCSPFAPPPLSSYVVAFACRKSRAAGVGHVANCAAIGRINSNPLPLIRFSLTASRRASHAVPVFPASIAALGVGHPLGSEEQPLSDVRRPDARSAQIGGPDGVPRAFQVSANNVEPREASSARNLLAKHDWRAALADEAEPLGPEVALVVEAEAGTGAGEGLAGARAGPDGAVVGPPGESKGVGPGAEAGEGVELGSAHNVS